MLSQRQRNRWLPCAVSATPHNEFLPHRCVEDTAALLCRSAWFLPSSCALCCSGDCPSLEAALLCRSAWFLPSSCALCCSGACSSLDAALLCRIAWFLPSSCALCCSADCPTLAAALLCRSRRFLASKRVLRSSTVSLCLSTGSLLEAGARVCCCWSCCCCRCCCCKPWCAKLPANPCRCCWCKCWCKSPNPACLQSKHTNQANVVTQTPTNGLTSARRKAQARSLAEPAPVGQGWMGQRLLGLDLHGCTNAGTHVRSPASTSNNDAGNNQPETSVWIIARTASRKTPAPVSVVTQHSERGVGSTKQPRRQSTQRVAEHEAARSGRRKAWITNKAGEASITNKAGEDIDDGIAVYAISSVDGVV